SKDVSDEALREVKMRLMAIRGLDVNLVATANPEEGIEMENMNTKNNVAEELKGGNKMNTTINYNGLKLEGEKALVVYNKISAEDIRWGQRVKTGVGEAMSLLQKDLEKEVNLT